MRDAQARTQWQRIVGMAGPTAWHVTVSTTLTLWRGFMLLLAVTHQLKPQILAVLTLTHVALIELVFVVISSATQAISIGEQGFLSVAQRLIGQ